MLNRLIKRDHNVTKVKSLNTLSLCLLIALLTAMASVYFENSVLKMISYCSDILLIIYSLRYWRWEGNRHYAYLTALCFIIIVINYIISPYEHSYSDLIKYFGYLCLFKCGNTLARKYDKLQVNKILIYLIVLTPLVLVSFFDRTEIKSAFFVTPNTFVYVGLSMGLFYLLVNNKEKKSFWIAWLIVAFYVLICTSLGVVVAIALAYLILNMKISHLPIVLVGVVVFIFAILYIDIPLFTRFKDVINLWTSMSSDDWKYLQDINVYELQRSADVQGERASDVTSSVWRLAHWLELFIDFVKEIWTIPFGLGVGYSIMKTGFLPHNDYLLILTEYGLFVFICFTSFILRVYQKLKNEGLIVYFILSAFSYHLTENLIQIFPPNAILYFAVGWYMYKYNQNYWCPIKNLTEPTEKGTNLSASPQRFVILRLLQLKFQIYGQRYKFLRTAGTKSANKIDGQVKN